MDPVTEHKSMEWIRRVGEYRTLAGKRDSLGFPLDATEAARLDELELFFTACSDPERAPFITRNHERAAIHLVVTFRAGQNDIGCGEARDISGEGLFISTAQALPVGSSTVVRIIDRFLGDEWRFAAEVVRVERGGMGLKLIGIPVVMRVGHRAALKAA
jgi:hypothetical protein